MLALVKNGNFPCVGGWGKDKLNYRVRCPHVLSAVCYSIFMTLGIKLYKKRLKVRGAVQWQTSAQHSLGPGFNLQNHK